MVTSLLILTLSFLISTVYSDCKSGWQRYLDSCYHVSRDIASWTEAEKMCELHGGTLAHIESAQEQGFIQNILHPPGALFWIGGSDWSKEGEWVWEPDGTNITYTNWYQLQPDNGGGLQHCLVINGALDYKWLDEVCHTPSAFYVCEMKRNSEQTTSKMTGTTSRTMPATTKPILTSTPLE